MKKFIKNLAVIVIAIVVMLSNSVSLATEAENSEDGNNLPPLTDKSIERTYDSSKNLYKYKLSENTSFSCSIPNGMIINEPVKLNIPAKTKYKFTRNGEAYEYLKGEDLDLPGIYRLTITVENTSSNLIFELPEIPSFSFDETTGSYETVEPGVATTEGIEPITSADQPQKTVQYRDQEFEFVFRILGKVCNNIGVFNLPEGFGFRMVTFNDDVVSTTTGDYMKLEKDGSYYFQIYDKSNPTKTFETDIKLDMKMPLLEITGVDYGLSTSGSVKITSVQNDVNFIVKCDGNEIKPYNGSYAEPGIYTVIATDNAGNTNTYNFRILYTLNISGFTILAIFIGLAVFMILYVRHLRTHMKVA